MMQPHRHPHIQLEHRDLAITELRDNHRLAWRTYLQRPHTLVSADDPAPDPHA
jgi:hypothetical protein